MAAALYALVATLVIASAVRCEISPVSRKVSPPPSTSTTTPHSCHHGCRCSSSGRAVRCRNLGWHRVPPDLPAELKIIDLAYNNISELSDLVFAEYPYLEELNLASNGIQALTKDVFYGLDKLKELSLQDNNLSSVPWLALAPLNNLESLRLDGNRITNMEPSNLNVLGHLLKLWLGNNRLEEVPTNALAPLRHLEALHLGNNRIEGVKDGAFRNLTQLVILVLERNRIRSIAENAFAGLVNLKVLEINDNRLIELPEAIRKLPALEQLSFASNKIASLNDGSFTNNVDLVVVEMKGNPLTFIGHNVFANMTKLKKLIISAVKNLNRFPNLNGTRSLEILRLDRATIEHVPSDLCHRLNHLKSLDLKSNRITAVPNLTECEDLRLLDMSNNRIWSINGALFSHQHNLHDLLLADNIIREIPVDAFMGLEKLQILDLMNNEIAFIHENAFVPLKHLEDLNLGNNRFPELPPNGLENVRQLKTFNNRYLRDFPQPLSFPNIQTLALSYAYHCCEFLPLSGIAAPRPTEVNEIVLWPPKDKSLDMSLWNSNNTDLWPAFENLTARFGEFGDEIWGNDAVDFTYPTNLPQYIEDYFEEHRNHHSGLEMIHTGKHSVHCLPQPGPFMPCEDLFDWWTLRCGIWIVFLLAMLGNGTVVFVLVFSRSKMDVPRFLVCNLAMADFFMGIYLGFLAVVDASTLGEFKKHAIRWQNSGACQTAGFLGVLSSELSVYTLAVITLERNYAITHAMHLNKRLSLKHAAYIMTCGWTFALVVASLPLFGISDYRKFAICLPFETEDVWSLAYVVFLMSVNGLAFMILMGCYLKMYCAIRGSQAWNSNDSRIAKRMALLVFTDFICWAPIAFFSLTATFGIHLISLEEAKVFTIFVLPLNSCANPFLYAILTKQFKKDCVLICKAIEESRVTRGIGRCRHSSNFSNRQTPGNTNSVVERNSSNNGQVCSCQLKSNDTLPNNTNSELSRTKLLKPPSWRLRTVRYLLCDAGIDREQEDSGNEYAYALAEIQRGQAKKHHHHQRNSSVSSENFSSSRSDSWRQNKGSAPMRLLESKRRRNSWTITRKPSQDSNLSNSRNDSSATTASTSTWRISRSSVSSDGSAVAARSVRDKPTAVAGDHAAAIAANAAVGASVRMRERTPLVHSPPSRAVVPARARPKLQRQMAIAEDSWPVRDVQAALQECQKSAACDDDNGRPPDRTVCFQETNERSTATAPGLLSGFVPRKLSTISSRSCGMNQEGSVNPPSTEEEDPFAAGSSGRNRSASLLNLTAPPQVQNRSVSEEAFASTHSGSGGGRRVSAPFLYSTDHAKKPSYRSVDNGGEETVDDSLLRCRSVKILPDPSLFVDSSKERQPLLDEPDVAVEPQQ